MPTHVTQRGNHCENVFFCDDDRQRYLQFFLKYSAENGLVTLAYCLMSNHVHFVCVPGKSSSLADVFKPLNVLYTNHVNQRQRMSGRLWQGRFYSCMMDDAHLRAAVRYVERNPVRAGMVARAEDYPWSSAGGHCGLRRDFVVAPLPADFPVQPQDWSAWLRVDDVEQDLKTLRTSTRTGMPAGDKTFIQRLEAMVGRILTPKPRGRPKKKEEEK